MAASYDLQPIALAEPWCHNSHLVGNTDASCGV